MGSGHIKNRFEVDVLVFDLDGTLIDSKKDIADSLNATFHVVGYDPLPMPVISSFVGNGIRPLIDRAVKAAGHPDRGEEVLAVFRGEYMARLLNNTTLFNGVEETLETLADRYDMAIITNKPAMYTGPVVDGIGLRRFFGDMVYSGDTLPQKKPDPAPLLEVARRFSAEPSRLLMVGDSATDINAGLNAGARTVGVTYGFRDVSELADAEQLIDNFPDLLPLLST